MFDNPPLNPIGFLGADWWGSDARAAGAELRRRGYLLIERHYEDYFPTPMAFHVPARPAQVFSSIDGKGI